MTVLQAAYAVQRARGRKHDAAIRFLAREYGLDMATVERVLARAKPQ